MLDIIEEQAKAAEAARLKAASVLHSAEVEAAKAAQQLEASRVAKAEIDAEKKAKQERARLASLVELRSGVAADNAKALEAAQAEAAETAEAAKAAKAKLEATRFDLECAEYAIAKAIGELLSGDKRMTEAEMLASLPGAIEAERNRELNSRLGGLGGGVPLAQFDRLAAETDYWLGEVRGSELVSLYWRGDHWRDRAEAKDIVAKAKPDNMPDLKDRNDDVAFAVSQDRNRKEAATYLRSKDETADWPEVPAA